MAKYHQVIEGQWQQPTMRAYKFCCCDCGLVHRMQFRVRRGRLEMRGWRDERATGQVRRWKKAKSKQETTS